MGRPRGRWADRRDVVDRHQGGHPRRPPAVAGCGRVRVVTLPLSFLLFGLGFVGIVSVVSVAPSTTCLPARRSSTTGATAPPSSPPPSPAGSPITSPECASPTRRPGHRAAVALCIRSCGVRQRKSQGQGDPSTQAPHGSSGARPERRAVGRAPNGVGRRRHPAA